MWLELQFDLITGRWPPSERAGKWPDRTATTYKSIYSELRQRIELKTNIRLPQPDYIIVPAPRRRRTQRYPHSLEQQIPTHLSFEEGTTQHRQIIFLQFIAPSHRQCFIIGPHPLEIAEWNMEIFHLFHEDVQTLRPRNPVVLTSARTCQRIRLCLPTEITPKNPKSILRISDHCSGRLGKNFKRMAKEIMPYESGLLILGSGSTRKKKLLRPTQSTITITKDTIGSNSQLFMEWLSVLVRE